MTQQRSKERQEERKKQQQRRRLIFIVGAAATAVAILIGLWAVANAPAEAPVSAESFARYEGLPQGVNENGYPLLGRVDNRVQVVEFSAFTSPEAYAYYRDVFPALLERVRRGEIAYAVAPVRNASGSNPEGAARAALCAGEQGRFWAAREAFFEWANTYGNSAFTTNRLREGINTLGLSAPEFNECFGSGRVNDILFRAQQGIASVPTVRVNGVVVAPDLEAINQAIDALNPTADTETPRPSGEATAELTPEATPETTEQVPTATNTAVTPTATNTRVRPTATRTPVPPTATNTAVTPTATNTRVRPTPTATFRSPASQPVQASPTPTSGG
jgi:hypothetical protein